MEFHPKRQGDVWFGVGAVTMSEWDFFFVLQIAHALQQILTECE